MSDDEVGTQHEQVVTSLLDLQRRLRGDTTAVVGESPPTTTDRDDSVPDVPPPPTPITVKEGDVQVMTSAEPPVPPTPEAELAAFTNEDERLGFAPVTPLPRAMPTPLAGDESPATEERIAALQSRLDRLEDDLSGVLGTIDGLRSEAEAARASETAILDAMGTQREELRASLDQGFELLQETLMRLRQGGLAASTDDDVTSID